MYFSDIKYNTDIPSKDDKLLYNRYLVLKNLGYKVNFIKLIWKCSLYNSKHFLIKFCSDKNFDNHSNILYINYANNNTLWIPDYQINYGIYIKIGLMLQNNNDTDNGKILWDDKSYYINGFISKGENIEFSSVTNYENIEIYGNQFIVKNNTFKIIELYDYYSKKYIDSFYFNNNTYTFSDLDYDKKYYILFFSSNSNKLSNWYNLSSIQTTPTFINCICYTNYKNKMKIIDSFIYKQTDNFIIKSINSDININYYEKIYISGNKNIIKSNGSKHIFQNDNLNEDIILFDSKINNNHYQVKANLRYLTDLEFNKLKFYNIIKFFDKNKGYIINNSLIPVNLIRTNNVSYLNILSIKYNENIFLIDLINGNVISSNIKYQNIINPKMYIFGISTLVKEMHYPLTDNIKSINLSFNDIIINIVIDNNYIEISQTTIILLKNNKYSGLVSI